MRQPGLVALLVACLAAGPVAAAGEPIRPGACVDVIGGGCCTLNFVFKDAKRRLYVGTAGHCAGGVGRVAKDAAGRRIGTVVFQADERAHSGLDFALVAVDRGRYPDVNPSVTRWGGPTGVASPLDTAPLDRIRHYGHGIGFGANEATRAREGVLTTNDQQLFASYGLAAFGDSGSPAIHAPSGLAVGVLTWLSPGTVGFVRGPTVQWVLERLAQARLRLSLVTAAYSPA